MTTVDLVRYAHRPGHPRRVRSAVNLPDDNRSGWAEVEIGLDDPHTRAGDRQASRRLVSLQMRQPVRERDTGIWGVDGGVWLG